MNGPGGIDFLDQPESNVVHVTGQTSDIMIESKTESSAVAAKITPTAQRVESDKNMAVRLVNFPLSESDADVTENAVVMPDVASRSSSVMQVNDKPGHAYKSGVFGLMTSL